MENLNNNNNNNNNNLQIVSRLFNLHRADDWSISRPFVTGQLVKTDFSVFLVHPVRFIASFKMGIGDYPAEYNPKVHGPYDPARYYGTPDKPFGQLKLGEVTIFFSRYFNLTTHPGTDEHVPRLHP